MILCCGEALIDMLPLNSATGEDAFAPYPGGSVFNTAIALGRLGAKAGLFSGISTDFFGETLIRALEASHVDARLAVRADRPTTLAFVTLEDGQARYAFYDEGSAGRMLDETDLPDISDRVQACFFGGISLMVEPCASTYEALAARAHAAGKLVMLDPNIRPDFIDEPEPYRARLARMLAMADIVKMSDEDLGWLTGETGAEGAAMLLQAGPKLVVITEGTEGAVAYGSEAPVRRPARQVEVVDTVGAGDTFNAGILAGLAREGLLEPAKLASISAEQLARVLDLGISAAAVTVSRAGANPPWASEL